MSALKRNQQQGQIVLTFLFCLLGLLIISPLPRLSFIAARHDQQVLHVAKTAVINWALARYPRREEKRDIRLGEMVMPDKHAPREKVGAGTQDSTASIGRLPWRTLGIPPLFDAHGEALWYIVSSRFRDNGQHVNAIHCRSLYQIAIYARDGDEPILAKGIAAVIIAPHRALSLQQRQQDTKQQNQVYQYIESAHKDAGYLRTGNYLYRHLMQGNIIRNGRLTMNDTLLSIECALLESALERRRHG